MNRKLAVTLSGCAALVLTLTACGDDSDARTETWAKNVCDGVQPQVRKIQTANAAISEASEGSRSAAEVQEADSVAFGEISAAYEALASTVDGAGDPPVDDGEQLRLDAVRELNGISESYGSLKEAIDGLDPAEQGDFAQGLKDIADKLEKLGQSGDKALGQLQSGDLGTAMARQEGCQSPPEDAEEPADDDADADGEDGGDGDDGAAEAGTKDDD